MWTHAQSIATNLLRTIPLNRPLTFDVRIAKGNLTSFSRYQMDVPAGVVVQEIDSRGGTFSFEENKVKIIWVTTPAEEEIKVRMKILPLKSAAKGTFVSRYFYVDQEQKHEYECLPFHVTFKDTVMPVLLSSRMYTLSSKSPQLIQPSVVNISKVDTKDPQRVKQQVLQLRKDSREAALVGERERKKAQDKIDALRVEEERIKNLPDGEEKTKVLSELQSSLQQARDELVVAERVVTLSKTLEGNANEIDRVNRKVNPASYADDQAVASGRYKGPLAKESPAAKPGSMSGQGIFYKIQIGAFREDPVISRFRNLGKVSVEKENETYKVLIGSFASRDEAYRKKEELSRQIEGCFVVGYRNGQRVR